MTSYTFKENYEVFERENNLFFAIQLTNQINRLVMIDESIRPFSLYSQEEHISANFPFVEYRESENIKFEGNGEIHTFKFNLSYDYELKEGINDYEIIYSSHFFDLTDNEQSDPKYFKSITFKWYKFPDSDKGYLVGDVNYPVDNE